MKLVESGVIILTLDFLFKKLYFNDVFDPAKIFNCMDFRTYKIKLKLFYM